MIFASSFAIVQETNIPNQNQYMFEKEYLTSLSELIKAYDIPGLSLALISDKKIVTFEYGVKNSIYQDPVTSSTVFEAASLSKPLIAYAALELCENGLLEMDQPLSAYLQRPGSEDSFLSAVTLRHVLSHTGGFPTANLKPGDPLKLEFYPGSQFAYSGESFCYLGRVIEQITGDSLASYMQEHVLMSLKMDNSSFIWKEDYTAQAASPHDQKGLPTEKWKPVKAIASFSLHTTASDYAKFMIIARQFSAMSEIQEDLLEALRKTKLNQKVALALHSSAEAHGCKNTNLNTLELYLLDPAARPELEKALQLEPQERGYEVLLIEPYYKSLLNLSMGSGKNVRNCSALLTFLDLFHFPLRGQEQAEFMAERIPELKHIYKSAGARNE